jgi:hypothetical protein
MDLHDFPVLLERISGTMIAQQEQSENVHLKENCWPKIKNYIFNFKF